MGIGYHSILPDGLGRFGGCCEKRRRAGRCSAVGCARREAKYVRRETHGEHRLAVARARPILPDTGLSMRAAMLDQGEGGAMAMPSAKQIADFAVGSSQTRPWLRCDPQRRGDNRYRLGGRLKARKMLVPVADVAGGGTISTRTRRCELDCQTDQSLTQWEA